MDRHYLLDGFEMTEKEQMTDYANLSILVLESVNYSQNDQLSHNLRKCKDRSAGWPGIPGTSHSLLKPT